jgi:enoyl-CoA hydratase/carnithine racemase
MTAFPTLLYDKQGPVAHVSLNRPQALNAYNIQMRDDLVQALEAVRDDPEVRCLLITGQGRAFCAGADLTEFGSAPSQAVARRVRWQRDVWGQFLGLTKPVVAAVHGHCIGSGVEIMLLCDVRISASGAMFALPEVQLGMIPAAGGTQTLPRVVGRSRALDLVLTGRRWDATEALAMGLVTRVVPDGGLMEEAWRVAGRLAAADPDLVAAAKECLTRGPELPPEQGLAQGLAMETALALRAMT